MTYPWVPVTHLPYEANHFTPTLLPFLLWVPKSLLIYRLPFFKILYLLKKRSHLFYAFPPCGLCHMPMTLFGVFSVPRISLKQALDPEALLASVPQPHPIFLFVRIFHWWWWHFLEQPLWRHITSDGLCFCNVKVNEQVQVVPARSIHYKVCRLLFISYGASESVDPRPASSASPGNLLEMQVLGSSQTY